MYNNIIMHDVSLTKDHFTYNDLSTIIECSLACLNGGAADEHCKSCDCVTGYTGGNCSECDSGYHAEQNCTKCVKEDSK